MNMTKNQLIQITKLTQIIGADILSKAEFSFMNEFEEPEAFVSIHIDLLTKQNRIDLDLHEFCNMIVENYYVIKM